ncbi:MAG TPA: aldo/keto reductase [Candidatus Omnitrophota bacterium]|nr:aldo/keto reductase [Candidatus Omnitrophota bacterium]
MKERLLGKTKFRVSEIGFGCWPIGGQSYGKVSDGDSLRALETAWESGVNFFDTADVYGEGHSEELLGQFLKDKRRDLAIIATKVGWDFTQGAHKKNFDPEYIRSACEKSLKRLRMESIDLYQLHNPSLELIQRKEIFGVLEGLKKQGKIRRIGISVHTEVEAFAALQDHRVEAIQLIFNFLDQRMKERVFPEAEKKDVGVIAREPLASGILSGRYVPDHIFPKDDHRSRWMPVKRQADWEKVQIFKQTLKGKRISLVKAALEYLLGFDAVSTIIPGAKTRTQVLENVSASLEAELDREDIDRLETIYNSHEIFHRGLNPR